MAKYWTTHRDKGYVPVTIRERSRLVTCLWRRLPPWWLSYDRARALARWLP